ncbi:ribosome biogenesis protein BOP1 homolog [Schistocerca gregaria]|uniref:ribosome biogenesis protein BOP1 homolog n=1 Tax=Schistocerca gregaria TaxID=7010 RepID=UPI00211E554B|nr:ribosome biogenesis protein BOP1 homolog [Schistocerca gregaria]
MEVEPAASEDGVDMEKAEERLEEMEKKHLEERIDELEDEWMRYDSDDSENERTLVTIGDVPVRWYEALDHLGYDLEGEKVKRPKGEGEVDRFLALNRDRSGWMSVYNEKTGKRELISEGDMKIIEALREGVAPAKYDPEHWFIPVCTMNPDVMPTSGALRSKRGFVPSRWEAQRIRRLAYALRKGWIKKKVKKEVPRWYMMWNDDEGVVKERGGRVPPPRMRLPGNVESYRPPEEYLYTEEELKKWNSGREGKMLPFVPKRHNGLREVSAYKKYLKERFERCLDLYLCTREQRRRKPIDLKKYEVELPNPDELRPFPSIEMQRYVGHEGYVRKISLDPKGEWLVSGCQDGRVRLYEIKSTRLLSSWSMNQPITCVAWCPNATIPMIAITTASTLGVLVPLPILSPDQIQHLSALWNDYSGGSSSRDNVQKLVSWMLPTSLQRQEGWRLFIEYDPDLTGADLHHVSWHPMGNYISTSSPSGLASSILIHQISKKRTQKPFKSSRGIVHSTQFHPSKPLLFVATHHSVRVYDLSRSVTLMNLRPNAKMISCISVHPSGDHLLVGTYDKKVCWFDLDLGSSPYKVFRYHKQCVRSVQFHPRYPLFATCSDDGSIHVYHATVYQDLLTNPLIVPLKVLRGHSIKSDLGVLDLAFHPTQPWLFSAGSDRTVRLFV